MSDIALKFDAKAEAFDLDLSRDRAVGVVNDLIINGTFGGASIAPWIAEVGTDAAPETVSPAGTCKIKSLDAAFYGVPNITEPVAVVQGSVYTLTLDIDPVGKVGAGNVQLAVDDALGLVIVATGASGTLSGTYLARGASVFARVFYQAAVTADQVFVDNISMVGLSGQSKLISTGFALDSGLESAVILSLYCDRKVAVDDAIPDGTLHRRGWWADTFARVEGDLIGSRMWLVDRSKVQAQVLLQAREYALEALRWLIDDGIARAVDVQVSVIHTNVLGVDITIKRLDGGTFRKLWELQLRSR